MQRRSVHDRARKDMKDDWTKTCRQVVSCDILILKSNPNHQLCMQSSNMWQVKAVPVEHLYFVGSILNHDATAISRPQAKAPCVTIQSRQRYQFN
jgi:hypothetical protein